MSFYRREVRVGHSLLLKESNTSWIKIDVLCLDGMRVQVGVNAPVDYPSRRVDRDLMIGPVRVFVLHRVGIQKILMGIKAPRRFSVVRRDDREASGVKQSKTRAKKTGGPTYVSVVQQQNRGGENAPMGVGGAYGGEKPLLRSDLDQR